MKATWILAAVCCVSLLSLHAAEIALPWKDPDKEKADKLREQMRKDLPADTFSFRSVGPWLIATNMDKEDADNTINSTISRFAAAIQRQLFKDHPRTEPVKVLLFKDMESYNFWNQKLFNEKPSSPFGYYSRANRAMVMNIGTGGGTLIHEMVHAMAEADFENIPTWLNEGLGSLFEASSMDMSGKVTGVTNWRLKGLLEDLDKGTALHVADVLKMSTGEFYGDRRASAYATARYLMQYLQENGKLEAFYTRVRDGKDADGVVSLRAVFDDKLSVEEIEKQYYEWVKKLPKNR
jgi:hypothetical protein